MLQVQNLTDAFPSRDANQAVSTQRQFPLPVFWGHQTRARGADREHVCYTRFIVEEPSLKGMSAQTQSCPNRAVGHPGCGSQLRNLHSNLMNAKIRNSSKIYWMVDGPLLPSAVSKYSSRNHTIAKRQGSTIKTLYPVF